MSQIGLVHRSGLQKTLFVLSVPGRKNKALCIEEGHGPRVLAYFKNDEAAGQCEDFFTKLRKAAGLDVE